MSLQIASRLNVFVHTLSISNRDHQIELYRRYIEKAGSLSDQEVLFVSLFIGHDMRKLRENGSPLPDFIDDLKSMLGARVAFKATFTDWVQKGNILQNGIDIGKQRDAFIYIQETFRAVGFDVNPQTERHFFGETTRACLPGTGNFLYYLALQQNNGQAVPKSIVHPSLSNYIFDQSLLNRGYDSKPLFRRLMDEHPGIEIPLDEPIIPYTPPSQ